MAIRIIPSLAPGEKWVSNSMFLWQTGKQWIHWLKWPFKKGEENLVSEEQKQMEKGESHAFCCYLLFIGSLFLSLSLFKKKSHTWLNVLLSPSWNYCLFVCFSSFFSGVALDSLISVFWNLTALLSPALNFVSLVQEVLWAPTQVFLSA